MKANTKYNKNRSELIDEMLQEYGYLFCSLCGKNKCGMKFEVHHIIFRSEKPNHPNLHDKINLIIVGSKCHSYLHSNKSQRNPILKSRGLERLFDLK